MHLLHTNLLALSQFSYTFIISSIPMVSLFLHRNSWFKPDTENFEHHMWSYLYISFAIFSVEISTDRPVLSFRCLRAKWAETFLKLKYYQTSTILLNLEEF